MATTIRRTYIDFKGLCQLTWVGRLISIPGPKENIAFRAYFTKIHVPVDNVMNAHRKGLAFCRDIPAGDIIDIPIGTLFYGGVPLKKNADPHFSIQKTDLRLDLTEGNMRIIDRWARLATDDDPTAEPRLVLPRARASLPDDPEYNGAMLCIGENGDPFAYVIPCYEIFRFFYAVSSKMAQVFLDSRFLEWGRYVWNPDRSSIDLERREAMLWLRQWMLDNDAWFIATLAFDPIALKRGMDLYRSIAVDRSRILRAVPPMQGLINVVAKWVPIRNNTGTTSKVILRLMSTDWRPAFDKLQFDRDNDGRRSKNDDGTEKEPIVRQPPRPTTATLDPQEDNLVDLTNVPVSPDFPYEQITIDEVNDRFQWLMTSEIEKLPQLETPYEGDKYIQLLNDRWTTLLSTLDGTTSSDAVQSVVLTGADLELIRAHEEKEENDNQEKPDDTPPPTPHGDLLAVAQQLADIAARKLAKVEFLALWNRPIPVGAFSLYQLPKSIAGERLSWLFRAKTETTRMALAAKIVRTTSGQFGSETRFILDFEPNPANTSIVIVWTESARELTPHDLRRLIHGFAQTRSVTRDQSEMSDESRIGDLKIGRRKHTKNATTQSAAEFLTRIFSTKPLGEKDDSEENTESK